MKRFFILFFISNLLLSAFFIEASRNDNITSRSLPVFTFFENGHFQIDQYRNLTMDKSYVNGHYYMDKAPFSSLLVMPLYGILKTTGIIKAESPEGALKSIYVLGGVLCGSVSFSIILLLLFIQLVKLPFSSSISPVLLAMLPFYGSFLFVFSGAFFGHLLAGMLLLSAYLLLKKENRFIAAGVLSGLAFITEFPVGIFIFIWSVQIWLNEKKMKPSLSFIAGALPSVFFLLIYNYYFTGSAFTMLYHYDTFEGAGFDSANTLFGFRFPSFNNLWEMIFGQYRGLLFYMPILLLIGLELYKHFSKPNRSELLKNYLLIPCVLFFLLILSMGDNRCWGGWTYGPRYLIPIITLLAYEGILFLATQTFSKWLFAFLSLVGITFAWLAKSTITISNPSEIQHPVFDFILPKMMNGEFNSNNLLTMLFNIPPDIACYTWIALFIGTIILLSSLYRTLQTKQGNH